MLNFSEKTYANLRDTMLRDVSNSLDKREGGVIMTSIAPAAYAFEEFYLALDQIQQNAFLGSAVGQYLDYIGALSGTERKQATKAVRLGVFSMEIPIGSRFSTVDVENSIVFVATKHIDGNNYEMTAETAGTIGNEYTGQILPIDFIYGLEWAEITDVLVSGSDIETDEDYRSRIINSINDKPFAGNVQSYIEYITAIDGVGGVQVYPTWNGGGTVKCVIITTDYKPASETLIDNVQTIIDPEQNQGIGLGMAPIGAAVTISTCTEKTIDIEATVKIAQGYDFGQVEPLIIQALTDYFSDVAMRWDKPTTAGGVDYALAVYISQAISAMLSVQGVINATNVHFNNLAEDVILEETSALQEIPKLGEVTINVET